MTDFDLNPFDPSDHAPMVAFEPELPVEDTNTDATSTSGMEGATAAPLGSDDNSTSLMDQQVTKGETLLADNHTAADENPFEMVLDASTLDSSLSPPSSSPREAEILPVCWRRESRVLLDLAVPAVLVNLLFVAMGSGSQMLVGHISSDALAASVCSNLLYNVLFFFLFGFAGALDTLGAQSFGAGSMRGLSLWTRRALILVSMLTLPIAMPMFFSYGIMHSILGQSPEIATEAQSYCRWLCLGLWPFTMTVVLQKYLQAQGIMQPTIWIGAVANVLNMILEALLIWPAGMGLQGGALGMSLARIVQFIMTAWYTFNFVKDQERAELDRVAAEVNGSYIEKEASLAAIDNGESNATLDAVPINLDQATNSDGSDSQATPPPTKLALLRQSSTRAIQNGARRLGRTVSEHALILHRGAQRSMRQLASAAGAAVVYARNPKDLVRDVSTLHRESMEGVWNKAAIKTFVILGCSSGIMTGLESWAFESTGVMATSLTLLELDAHYVLLNIALITFFTFPFGVSIAASIRIGNLVGAGHVQTAQLTAKIVTAVGAGFMAISGILLASTHSFIGYLFSNDADVVAQVSRIAPIGGLFQVFDGIQGSIAGVLRGLGLQRAAALSNLIGLWCFGVTIAYLLAFPAGMGLPGLWWGLAVGLMMTAAGNSLCLYRTDWNKQVEEAQVRIKADEAEYEARRLEIEEEATRGQTGLIYERVTEELQMVPEL